MFESLQDTKLFEFLVSYIVNCILSDIEATYLPELDEIIRL